MILLDTNVITAIMHLEREPAVLAWLDQQQDGQLYLPTPVMFETCYGIAKLDAGRKRRELERRNADIMADFFINRVLPFDASAAKAAGVIYAMKAFRGRKERLVDIQIAGIAKALNASVAARNVKDFTGMGVTIINPWDAV
jgi:toxin FitB